MSQKKKKKKKNHKELILFTRTLLLESTIILFTPRGLAYGNFTMRECREGYLSSY